MRNLRRSSERGFADYGTIKSHHSFSFATYHDPRFMGWGNLRVINEDRVAPGQGFGAHSHRDMEIISYVLAGELAHKDSLGNVETIPAGDIQRMSAGTGITHSEFNHATDAETHFLQIWIAPDQRGLAPDYEQRAVDARAKRGRLFCVVSKDGDGGLIRLNADAAIHLGAFDEGETARHSIKPGRLAYVHLIRGTLNVSGVGLSAGDALMVADEPSLVLAEGRAAEVLVFDLAGG